MKNLTLLTIGSAQFLLRRPEDAAKVLAILAASQPVEERYDRDAENPHRITLRAVDLSYSHRVTLETRPLSQLATSSEPKRVPKQFRLEGGAA